MRARERFKRMSNAGRVGKRQARIAALVCEAGLRARSEAAVRRAAAAAPRNGPREIGGADGPDPTRFGDWERKGVISDF